MLPAGTLASSHHANCQWIHSPKENLIQNSQAVKNSAALRKAMVKRYEIQGDGQGMAVMVG